MRGFASAAQKQHFTNSVGGFYISWVNGKAGVEHQWLDGSYLNPIHWVLFDVSTSRHFQQRTVILNVKNAF